MGRQTGALSSLVAAWRRYLLQREVKFAWGSRPRVIVHRDGDSWIEVLNDRWLPSSTERTLVLGAPPQSTPRSAEPLEWRVYHAWGPDGERVLSPVALIVHKSGRVERLPFDVAMRELAAGNDTLLQAQLDELARLSHHP